MGYIKIFGQTRCGTNYITEITKKNFTNDNILVFEFCSKHNKLFVHKNDYNKIRVKNEGKILKDLKENNKQIDVLIIIKNPYAWYNSMKNWRAGGSSRANNKHIIKHKMDIYTDFYDYYLSLNLDIEHWGKKMIIKYEDLLKNPDKVLKDISLTFKTEREQDMFLPSKVNHSKEFTEDRKEFYLNPKDNYGLTDFEIKEINKHIIPSKYGYKKINV